MPPPCRSRPSRRWELLFDRLQVPKGNAGNAGDAAKGQSLLIVGAAGGVGSVMVQLARQLTGLTVIGYPRRARKPAIG